MKTEYSQDQADELTSEQVAAFGATVENFMRSSGLKFGYTMLVMDRNGLKTMGNIDPAGQREIFEFIANQLANGGPDSMETVTYKANH